MRYYVICIVFVFIIFPSSLNGQKVLNIKGNAFISTSAQYTSQLLSFDAGYNMYITSKLLYTIKGRYIRTDVEATNYHFGFLSANMSYKLLDVADMIYLYGFAGGNFGLEHLSSNVESKTYNGFPVNGLLIGTYGELRLAKRVTATLSADLNNLWNSKMGDGFYTVRIGINYYL